MIGDIMNFDDVYIRDLTTCLLDTLEGQVTWINRFASGNVGVTVSFYYSLSGDERMLLDSFVDDVASENRKTEINTDPLPKGYVTLNNFQIKSDEFANPNVWLKTVVENDTEINKVLTKVRAVPIVATYNVGIMVNSEIDAWKCIQSITNTLWLYKFMYFEYNYMHIDAVMLQPDSSQIEINRDINMTSDDRVKKLTFDLEVHSYYPAYIPKELNESVVPKRTRWFNNLIITHSANNNNDTDKKTT